MRAQVAVSAGIKDIDAAKAALSDRFKLAPGENGALLIQGVGRRSSHEGGDESDSDGDEGDHRACELAPAYGAAPMRIVCGMDAKSLGDLGPWLTRTAPRLPSTSDFHVDVRMQPLKGTISGFKRMFSVVAGGVLGEPSGVPGLRDAAISLGTDLVDFVLDLEKVSVDVQLSDAGAGLTATTRSVSYTHLGKATIFVGDMDELCDVGEARVLADELGADLRVFEGFDHHFMKSRRAMAEAARCV